MCEKGRVIVIVRSPTFFIEECESIEISLDGVHDLNIVPFELLRQICRFDLLRQICRSGRWTLSPLVWIAEPGERDRVDLANRHLDRLLLYFAGFFRISSSA